MPEEKSCRQAQIKHTTKMIKMKEQYNRGRIRKNPRKGYAHESREPDYESWHDKYKHGRQWYAESTFSAVKRKSGEFERATKAKNMSNEIKLKYIFYNTIIKYDMPHTSFFASPI